MPTHVGGWHMVHDERRGCTAHDHTMRLPCGTHRAPLRGHQHQTRYRDPYAGRTEQYAIPVRTILQMTWDVLHQLGAIDYALTTLTNRKQVSSVRSYSWAIKGQAPSFFPHTGCNIVLKKYYDQHYTGLVRKPKSVWLSVSNALSESHVVHYSKWVRASIPFWTQILLSSWFPKPRHHASQDTSYGAPHSQRHHSVADLLMMAYSKGSTHAGILWFRLNIWSVHNLCEELRYGKLYIYLYHCMTWL
jgi:hypothetical protein